MLLADVCYCASVEEFIKTGSYNGGAVILDQALVNRATTGKNNWFPSVSPSIVLELVSNMLSVPAYRTEDQDRDNEEIVVLLRILVHDCNYGYKLSNGSTCRSFLD